MSSNRRKIREKVMQALYAFELTQDPIDTITHDLFEELKAEQESYKFGQLLVKTVIENRQQIDKKIQSQVNNWEFKRIALIDRILIRIAICEFLFFPDIPPKVTLNEAIEIAKRYSTENSGKFVNGILDAILTSLQETDEIKKAGRGLLNKTVAKK